MADLGKVGITYDSAGYDSGKTYEPLTVLKYTDGGTYMSILPTTGHVPTDTNYWAVLVPPIDAGDIDYDNATSGLTATKVQSAIDELDTNVDGKAPTSHASTATTYGVGSTTNYGHCKTINNLTASSYVDGESLSAYQGKLLNDSLTNTVWTTDALIRYKKNTNAVTVTNTTPALTLADGWTTLGTLPVAYRPTIHFYGVAVAESSGVITPLVLDVGTDGTVRVYVADAPASSVIVYFNATYLL